MRSVHDFQTNVSCCCNNILERIQESLEFCLCLQFGRKAEQASSTLGRRSFSFLTVFFFFFKFNHIILYFGIFPAADSRHSSKMCAHFYAILLKVSRVMIITWRHSITVLFLFCFFFFVCRIVEVMVKGVLSISRANGGPFFFPPKWNFFFLFSSRFVFFVRLLCDPLFFPIWVLP